MHLRTRLSVLFSIVLFVALAAGCGGKEKDSPSDPPSDSSSSPAADDGEFGADYQEAIDDFAAAHDVDQDARNNTAFGDVPAYRAATAKVRADIFEFDAALRELTPPDDNGAAIADVLTQNGLIIAHLDQYAAADTTGFNTLYDAEEAIDADWRESINALAKTLEVVGLQVTVVSEGLSAVVPDGFEYPGFGDIELEAIDGTRIGVRNEGPLGSEPLEEYALTYCSDVAEKNGGTGPTSTEEVETAFGAGQACEVDIDGAYIVLTFATLPDGSVIYASMSGDSEEQIDGHREDLATFLAGLKAV